MAITVPTVRVRAARKVRIVRGRVIQRERVDSGVRRVERVIRGAEVMNIPNIQWDAVRTSLRAEIISLGRATVVR